MSYLTYYQCMFDWFLFFKAEDGCVGDRGLVGSEGRLKGNGEKLFWFVVGGAPSRRRC